MGSAKRDYRSRGFAIFRQALDPALVAAVSRTAEDHVRPYRGKLRRHDDRVVPHDYYDAPGLSPIERSRNGLIQAHLLRDGPVQPFAAALVRMLTSDCLFACFRALNGANHYTLHQSIFFFNSPLTTIHLDRMTLDTHPTGGAFAAWIPIDPIELENGPIFVVPRPAGQYDSGDELGIAVDDDRRAMRWAHIVALRRKMHDQSAELVAPLLHPGDVLVIAPSTPHGSFAPYAARARRLSIQAIYRATRYDRWGAYPDHHEPHAVATEETRITPHFSFLNPPRGA